MKLPRLALALPVGIFAILFLALFSPRQSTGQTGGEKTISAGAARIDITPEKPLRLSGYGSRTEPFEDVAQRLGAKALAIGAGTDESPLSVLITLDAIGIPKRVSDALAERLQEKAGLPRAHLAVAATHTHAAPALSGCIPFMFPSGMTDAERKGMERYTDDLLDRLEKVALAAIEAREPSRLAWGKGELGFATNRRVLENGKWKGFGTQEDGPVDHTFPLLRVEDADGNLTAVLANYACHCTTLGGNFNRIHGDWAGVAQEEIEERHPGAVALVAIGCGADQNPEPRGGLDQAVTHGKAMADEVDRLLREELTSLATPPRATYREIPLALDEPPARGVWEEQVREKQRGHHFADAMLEKLDRGEELEREFDYPVQTWIFGDDLAMVFLAGEVVVDFAHRFYREFDADRLWINAYANDVPCYLPSKRILGEGGYEVDYSRVYYGKPGRLALDTEDRIADEVLRQMPRQFYSDETKKLLPPPVEKEQALGTIRVPDAWTVELVAAEPLVRDPVDIAWDARGRLWVVEMADYPTGVDGEPGGRVRVLEDLNNDGLFERSTLFLDGLKYPNSVLPWRDGVLVVVADSILFARDTDDDGRADETETLFTGFDSGNSQHQLGGLEWGLDNWIHVGNGGSHGALTSTATGTSVELGSRDVRFRPDTGEVEPISGASQYGLTRDDRGSWFACNNSKPWWHYALADRYLRRNPHVAWPDTKVLLGEEPFAGPVFPASRTTSRFNDYDKANRYTSACGLELFRDRLPDSDVPCLFVAEPVHNLVSRLALRPDGATFRGTRLPAERKSEFFASTDNWCRPTSARTGPDGALYVVDMYRLVIEHPEWIPETWQRRLDLREGSDRGRIYRVRPKDRELHPFPVLVDISTDDLVAALDHRNGAHRDLVHREVLRRNDDSSKKPLARLVEIAEHSAARIQALAALDGLGGVPRETLAGALADADAGVRRQATRLAERFLREGDDELLAALIAQASDDDAFIRQQVAYSLGESDTDAAGETIADLLVANDGEPFVRSAALSSALPHVAALLRKLAPRWTELDEGIVVSLTRTVAGLDDPDRLAQLFGVFAETDIDSARLAPVVETLESLGKPLRRLYGDGHHHLAAEIARLDPIFADARTTATDAAASPAERAVAIRLLAGSRAGFEPDLDPLLALAGADEPAEVQAAAVRRGSRLGPDAFAHGLVARWETLGARGRELFLETVTDRLGWTRLLLNAIESQPALARGLGPMQRATLLHHRDEAVRQRAGELLAAGKTGTRGEVLERFAPALEGAGDPERGRQHFAVLCASCHRMNGVGFNVGPDLAALTNKSREALLVGILDPNRAVESKYAMYVAETKDDRSVSGILASETASGVTLLGAGGQSETLVRERIVSLASPGISLMPEGLEEGLDETKMADLLAYLKGPATDSRVVPDSRGEIRLPVEKASAEGPAVHLDSRTKALSDITHEDAVTWSVAEVPAGDYAVFFDAALDAPEIGSPGDFTLAIGDRTLHGTVEKTGALNRLRKRQYGEIVIEESAGETAIRFSHHLPKGRLAIREIALIPRR
ncbi:MAG: neutral/alkaline non-lysosomal ceramidase N-terminal domain-containing protein [Verrucomicrobiales bacterium]